MSVYRRVVVSFVVLATTALLLFQSDIHRKSISFLSSDTTSFGAIKSLDLRKERKLDDVPATSEKADDKIDLKASIALAQDVLNLIRHRYELDGVGSMFALTANNVGEHTWDLIKYKFAKKILLKERFLMTFGGSSVTAGHDNYYNQSYPEVVRRRLGPVLAAAGIELQVHNIAQGPYLRALECMCYVLDKRMLTKLTSFT